MRQPSEKQLMAPLITISIGALATFVLSFFLWSQTIDRATAQREESLVRAGMYARAHEIETVIFSQTHWDDAVVNLDNKFSTEWADKNLSAYLAQTAKFDAVFIVNGDDKGIYGNRYGKTVTPGMVNVDGLRGLIADIRKAELARGPFPTGRGVSEKPISKPIQKSVFVRNRHQGLSLVTASLVQPDFGGALPHVRAPIVLTNVPVDADFLKLIAERFQIADLHTAGFALPGEAVVKLPVPHNRMPMTLVWTPQKPGAVLLQGAIGPVIVVLLAFATVAGVMIWRVRRATRLVLATSRAQTEFLANMSHELRTPLNGVIGIAGALGKTQLDERQAGFVDIIRQSGETLEHLLGDILDLASMETDNITVKAEPFSPAEVARATVETYTSRALAKGIKLELFIDQSAEIGAVGDVMRIKQILGVLIDNAVKFTAEGGVTVRLDHGGDDGAFHLSVEDTGLGFDNSQKRNIFRTFHQGDGSITRQFGGVGLGLSIASRLTGLMGGTIVAEGRPGEGATFTVVLPLPVADLPVAVAVAADEAGCMSQDAPDEEIRILLSDDHPTNRQVVQALLADSGVSLVSTENGLEACEAFEKSAFHVVLMDMQMPVMDGLSAIRRIREREVAEGLPRTFIIMLTANALPEHREASLAAGADLHVPKPIQADRLFAALNQAFEGGEEAGGGEVAAA